MAQDKRDTLLISAMLDVHYPLLRWAFDSRRYRSVVLEDRAGIVNLGLRYTQNDLCYPGVLIIGQFISALRSGVYDLAHTALLIAQAGDSCRGSNYICMIRKALNRAGFGGIPVLSLNVKGIERSSGLPLSPVLALRALAGAVYGDALLLLRNQVRPYEWQAGDTDRLFQQWVERLGTALSRNRALSPGSMARLCREMAADFARIPRTGQKKKQVAVVGELYMKYCGLGNGDIVSFLEDHGCEVRINGLLWYVLYYMESHLLAEFSPWRPLYRLVSAFVAGTQRDMIRALRSEGFHTPPPFAAFRRQAEGAVTFGCAVGDGWLIGAEIANHALDGCARILCVQPFGCLASHVCGRGLYAALGRRFPQTQLVSVDYDSSGTAVSAESRIRMLLENF